MSHAFGESSIARRANTAAAPTKGIDYHEGHEEHEDRKGSWWRTSSSDLFPIRFPFFFFFFFVTFVPFVVQ